MPAAWSERDLDALVTSFGEEVTGVDDQNGDTQTLTAVVQKVFERVELTPGSPQTRHYYQLTVKAGDLSKLGAVNRSFMLRGDRVTIKEIADFGTGIAEVICG